MMQVVGPDTKHQYVKCRGYDPRVDKSYHEDLADTISVAKPYQKRFPGVYRPGEVFPALLPIMFGAEDAGVLVPRIGKNAGRVEGDDDRGQPKDLTEELVHLIDDDGYYVEWLFMDTSDAYVYFELKSAYTQFSVTPVAAWIKIWDPSKNSGNGGFTTCGDEIYVADMNKVGHEAGANGYGSGWMRQCENDQGSSGPWICVINDLCCPGDEQGACLP
jgi:hypothetical protein